MQKKWDGDHNDDEEEEKKANGVKDNGKKLQKARIVIIFLVAVMT